MPVLLTPPDTAPHEPKPSGLGWLANVAAALIVGLLGIFNSGTGATWIVVLGDLVLAAAVVVRSRLPRLAVAIACLGGALVLTGTTPRLSLVAVPLVVYSAARWGDRLTRGLVIGVAAVATVLGPLRWALAQPYQRYEAGITMWISCALAVTAAYAVGSAQRASVSRQADRTAAALERARHSLVEREQQLRMATTAERNRIARELHDIVTHSLSVIVVQADGARALSAKRPEVALETLDTISQTSRRSLAEMRSMVRLLRGADDATDYVPIPGMADLPELVKTTGNATLTISAPPSGVVPTVSESIGLTVYRIVQESLTNVLNHAGPTARAEVHIGYLPQELRVTISDDGRGAAAGRGSGNGQRGMTERVELHGGRIEFGARVGGGYRVAASLPLPGVGETKR